MKTVSYALLISWIIISMFYLLTIFIDNISSADGIRLQQLNSIAERLRVENELLENKKAEKESLSYVEKEAEKQGFTKNVRMEYIK